MENEYHLPWTEGGCKTDYDKNHVLNSDKTLLLVKALGLSFIIV